MRFSGGALDVGLDGVENLMGILVELLLVLIVLEHILQDVVEVFSGVHKALSDISHYSIITL